MPLMNNILFSYNLNKFSQKKSVQSEQTYPKKNNLIHNMAYQKHTRDSPAQSVSLSILLIKSSIYFSLFVYEVTILVL